MIVLLLATNCSPATGAGGGAMNRCHRFSPLLEDRTDAAGSVQQHTTTTDRLRYHDAAASGGGGGTAARGVT